MTERIGLYPGTFDPITLGHSDIIRRGSKLVDRLIVGVTTNPSKDPMFTPEERLEMVRAEVGRLGVGNVEGRLLRADANASHPRESVLLRGGIVGYQLPALQASVIPITPGDLLIMATDGIHPVFEDGINVNETPKQIADKILSRHFKGNDDALVLVIRYLGSTP